MKQTAVEWLIEKLNQCEPMYSGVQSKEHKEYIDMLIEQAKEMEKENTINAHVTGLIDPLIMKNYKGLSVDEIKVEITKQAEEYYNEIFKKETR
jgi:hypothetical protein